MDLVAYEMCYKVIFFSPDLQPCPVYLRLLLYIDRKFNILNKFTMAANIGLNEKTIKIAKRVLNNLMADSFVLLIKTWNFHWNVKGESFKSYHVFMEELYNGLIEDIDEIAERIRALDERPIGSMKGYLDHNRLKEHDDEKALPDAKNMLAILSADNDELIREIRQDIETLEAEGSEDSGTLNFLEDMIERKEKTAWMIRSYIEK